jgi:hypothetical protein
MQSVFHFLNYIIVNILSQYHQLELELMQAQGIVDRERLKLQLETQQEAVLAMVKEEMIRERINEDVRLRAVHAEVFVPLIYTMHTPMHTYVFMFNIINFFILYMYIYICFDKIIRYEILKRVWKQLSELKQR